VGCNRWDGLWKGSPYAKAVSDKRWRHLWPFYTKVISENEVEINGDSQEVMDKEIEYAHNAGLDFWGFDYIVGQESFAEQYGYGYSLKRYLASAHKNDINFCLVVCPAWPGSEPLGPIEKWPETVSTVLVPYMCQPAYQKVLNNRPLFFVWNVSQTEKFFGSAEKARVGWDYLRQKAAEAGLGKPYIIAQVWSVQEGLDAVERLGYDAMSAYSWGVMEPTPGEHPYSMLSEGTKSFWEACKSTGRPMVPIVSTGFDNRPLQGSVDEKLYPQGTRAWFAEPTLQEFEEHFRSAIEWTKQNKKSAESNVVMIYAWNETGEGGRLVPTLDEGAARLDVISKVLTAVNDK
jgi:hypothetical protein